MWQRGAGGVVAPVPDLDMRTLQADEDPSSSPEACHRDPGATVVKLERRPLAGNLRHLAEKLHEGDAYRLGVALALESLAEEIDPAPDLCLTSEDRGPCLSAHCSC